MLCVSSVCSLTLCAVFAGLLPHAAVLVPDLLKLFLRLSPVADGFIAALVSSLQNGLLSGEFLLAVVESDGEILTSGVLRPLLHHLVKNRWL